MPSHAWNLVRATSRAAAARFATAAACSHDGRGAVNHPPPRRHLVGDDASSEGRPPVPSEFMDRPIFTPPRFNEERTGGALFNPGIRSDIECMTFDEEDLESDETLWDLYNRWCHYFNVARNRVKNGYRFNIFKERVHFVYERRKADPQKKLELNHMCDVAIDELCPPKRNLCRPLTWNRRIPLYAKFS